MGRWLTIMLVTVMLCGCAAEDARTPAPTVVPPRSAPTLPSTPSPLAPTAFPTATVAPTRPASPMITSATPTIPQPSEQSAAPNVPDATPTTLAAPAWSYPIGRAGGVAGDGFFMRHGFATENTWFNPGYWHTGEDWYAVEGDTAGAEVWAVADGEVVYAGSNYPGRVVIVRHADDLYAMYGHLDPALAVSEGQQVAQGDVIGTVLRRDDDVPNHLHFELRTFLFTAAVNGDAPRYGFRCGPGCAPGPGYWPIDAPDLPTALGWLNPTHVIANRSGWNAPGDATTPRGEVVVATGAPSPTLALWGTLDAAGVSGDPQGELAVQPGQRFPVVDVWAGGDAPDETGSTAYRLWYRLLLPDRRLAWTPALAADSTDQGSDGAPSSVRFILLPFAP